MSVSSEVLIKVDHLKKHFGELDVLNDISTEIRKGEVIHVSSVFESFGNANWRNHYL